jgi:hypothetical protein
MSQVKKTSPLRSVAKRRHSSHARRVAKKSDAAERLAIRQALAPHDIDSSTKKIIEYLAVEYGPALKRLADR